jgi:hypothetical protein
VEGVIFLGEEDRGLDPSVKFCTRPS